MMTPRPTITAEMLAAIIDAAPSRVRKRLDREPNAASTWQWNRDGLCWVISAGEETVRLTGNSNHEITQPKDITCSCLLTPKCFHVLACVTLLPLASGNDSSPSKDEDQTAGETALPDEQIEITAAMRQTAIESMHAIDGVMVSGARASGVIIQSSLLRAAHQARAEGLVHLSAALIRIAEGIQRLRRSDDHTDCELLRSDTVTAIDAANELLGEQTILSAKLGFLRRQFSPTGVKRLAGILAEPILTLSGFAGVVTHLTGDDGQIYQVVETRPGDVALIGQAYRGGIELGGTTASAQILSRSHMDVQNMSCSPDGRLGKGSKTRWVIEPSRGSAAPRNPPLSARWTAPLRDQVAAVFDLAHEPDWKRRGGWDLVSIQGKILGAHGLGVAFELDESDIQLTVGISIDHAALPFRENLQMLARCPGLKVEMLGRVRLERAGWIDGLSLRTFSDDLVLPDSWAGRCHLGLDRLQRQYFRHATRFATEVDDAHQQAPSATIAGAASQVDLFPGLDRRCTSLVIGGRGSIGPIASTTHRRDHARLISRGQIAAADILDAVAMACSEAPAVRRREGEIQYTDQFRRPLVLAAAEQYLRAARGFYEREKWMRVVG